MPTPSAASREQPRMTVTPLPVARLRLGAGALAGAAVIGVTSVNAPLLLIAGVLGIGFIAVTLRNLAAGLTAFTVLIFLAEIPTISSFGLTFTKLAGGVLAVAWVITATRRDPNMPMLTRRHPVIAYLALALLCWTFGSILWASDPGTAGATAFRFSQGVLLLFIIFSALRERRHLVWIMYAFVAGAVLSAMVGLAGGTGNDVSNTGRLGGGIGDPNDLAALLIPALAFALFMAVTRKRMTARWLLLAAAFVCALALFRTESRGGIVGLGVMLAASLALAGPVRSRAVALAFSITGVALVYFTLLAPASALGRLTSFTAGGGSGRTDIWAVALEITGNHPIAGVGAGNFQVVEPGYAFANLNLPRADLIVNTPEVVHNMYLHVLVELGVIGCVLFVLLIASVLGIALRVVRAFEASGDLEMEILTRGLVIGTIGMLAAFFFLSAQYDKQLPLLLGVLASLSTLVGSGRRWTALD